MLQVYHKQMKKMEHVKGMFLFQQLILVHFGKMKIKRHTSVQKLCGWNMAYLKLAIVTFQIKERDNVYFYTGIYLQYFNARLICIVIP